MQRFVSQLAYNVSRTSIRVFSTTNFLRDSSRPLKTRQYIENFYRDTHDPIWYLLATLQTSGGRREVTEALQKSNISVREFEHWMPVISQHDITSAVSKLPEIGKNHQQGADVTLAPAIPIPSWVVLYLVGFKVRTPAHAKGPLLDMVYSHLQTAPASIQGPLLILALSHLARFNLLIPIRRIVDIFLNTTLLDPHRQFNLFLQTLSSIPYRSVDNANNVVAILKAMEARQLKLWSATYESLLNDRFVTLQLTKFLLARMVREGFVPTVSHLEAYLRVFANNGAIHDAQKYHEAIHSTPIPIGEPGDEPIHVSKIPHYRANTILLGAHGDRTSAFNFLRTLMEQKTILSTKENKKEPPTQHLQRREVRFLHKPKSDVYDQTAALHVAAKDLSTSTRRLIQLFVKLTSRPTIATHTVLIRGLLFRKEFAKAEIFWSKLSKTGLIIDQVALTTGVQSLTRNGKPHAAFLLLEKYALKPTDNNSPSETSILHPPVTINTISMNEFLVSLRRISRPDAVFKFWDYMGVLYGTDPNTETLSILLQSARLACRMDDTLSGALAQMKLISPFRRRKVYQPNQSREEAVDAILTILGHPSRGGLRRYTSGIWKEQVPLEAARKVFLQALFGSDTERRLLSVEPPAIPMRASYDSDASDSGISFIPNISPKKYVFIPPPDLLTIDGKSHYPQIVVTNANCFNYITLLGVSGSGRAAEIPLVLAWMKELGIKPSDSTIAVALVFWAEVGVQAPLVERWTGGSENNEYSKLVGWIRDWVGEMRLPHGRTLYKWQCIVKKMRETSR